MKLDRSEHLKQQLDAARRAGFRQAAPCPPRTGPKVAADDPAGAQVRTTAGRACRPRPPQVDETCRASEWLPRVRTAAAPSSCPGWRSQYQEDLSGGAPHRASASTSRSADCSQCRRRVQGRHTAANLRRAGRAASVQLGPRSRRAGRAAAHAPGCAAGVPSRTCSRTQFGLTVSTGRPRAGCCIAQARQAAPTYTALCQAGAGFSRGHAGSKPAGAVGAMRSLAVGLRHAPDDGLRDSLRPRVRRRGNGPGNRLRRRARARRHGRRIAASPTRCTSRVWLHLIRRARQLRTDHPRSAVGRPGAMPSCRPLVQAARPPRTPGF